MRGETPYRMEPLLFGEQVPTELLDLAVEIRAVAEGLGNRLHPDSVAELADYVRIMNCYYSNLIEGHNTRPRDIERALEGAELDAETRPLALEARAHVLVQREIDRQHREGILPVPTSREFIQWAHRAFYDEMPHEFRFADFGDGRRVEIVPGQFRQDGIEVTVGRHQAPSSHRVEAFLEHFEKRYGEVEGSPGRSILAIPAAHHRLNFIHPFPDGNGRVSRLMSHAMALRAGIGGGGLWSISRGLARGLRERGEYKRMMERADMPRQGDRDGRGNLSERALQEFCAWFLNIVRDQIEFSASMFDLAGLDQRYRRLLDDVSGDRRAAPLMSAVLRHGELERGAAATVLRVSPATARKTLNGLVAQGFLVSPSPKAPVRIGFPERWRERLFPNLFPSSA